jgi:hypothetical protein
LDIPFQKLKQDIRDNVKLLSDLGMGTPIIAAIKRRIDDAKTEKHML